MYKNEWLNPKLGELLLEARRSYYIYGDLPPLDAYDQKSAIYMVRACYPGHGGTVEEWASTRLVPGDNIPLGTEDLNLFNYRGISLGDLIKERLFDNSENYLNFVVASSRTCAIAPRLLSGQDNQRSSPKYTAVCFSLIHHQFMREYQKQYGQSSYVVGTVVPKFINKALAIDGKAPSFMSSAEVLGISAPEELKLDREYDHHYVYRFPFYFLNRAQLLEVIYRLICEGILSERSISYYLETDLSFNELKERVRSKPELFRNLGKLLTVEGPIKHSTISGNQLRDIINKNVDDGPRSFLTKANLWLKSIEGTLSSGKFEVI